MLERAQLDNNDGHMKRLMQLALVFLRTDSPHSLRATLTKPYHTV